MYGEVLGLLRDRSNGRTERDSKWEPEGGRTRAPKWSRVTMGFAVPTWNMRNSLTSMIEGKLAQSEVSSQGRLAI